MSAEIVQQLTARETLASDAASRPFLSIVVPVLNEERAIAPTLRQLLEQSYPADRFEVLVADGGSTDATREIVANLQRKYSNLRLLDNPGRWSSAGRNVAVRAARGDIVILVDGHCDLANPDYLWEMALAFERSGADCVGRPQPLDVSEASPLQQTIAAARGSLLGHHPASFVYADEECFVPPESVAIAYRREVFARVGLFDESFDACEDVEFNHRVAQAGLRCWFTPRVTAHYQPRTTYAGLWKQLVRYGRGRVRLMRKHPETFTWPGFVPAAFVAGLLLGPLLALVWPLLRPVYVSALVFYVLVVLLFSTSLSLKHRRLDWLARLPLVFAAIHLAAGVGIWWEMLGGANRPAGAPSLLAGESI
jgi:succinoglycan biosynthesis protein ExoA